MKTILDARTHAVVDYVSAAVFVAAPTALKLGPTATKVSYGLAAFVILVSLVTNYPGGLVKKFSFSYHAMVEFYAAFALCGYGLFFQRGVDRVFFVAAAVCIFAIFLTTDYSGTWQAKLRSH